MARLISCLLLAGVLYSLVPGNIGLPQKPLPWDMSHHYLGAWLLNNSLHERSFPDFLECLQESDLYPPGHSLVLGTWLFAFGDNTRAVMIFGFATLLWSLILLWRAAREALDRQAGLLFLAGSLVVLMTAPYLALAKSLLVEPLAILFALWSLREIASDRLPPVRHVVVLVLSLTACLLTKYNTGLPLLPAACVVAATRALGGRKLSALRLALAAALALALGALFLSWQHDGWDNFLAFAVNRANSGALQPLERLKWYFDLYRNFFLPHPVLGWLVTIALLAGARHYRNPFWQASFTYVAVSLAALANHPYLLYRSLVAPAVVAGLLAGFGMVTLFGAIRAGKEAWRRAAVALTGCLAVAGLALTPAEVERESGNLFPADLSLLEPASADLQEWFGRMDACLLIGTFNEMSPAWTRFLWARSHAGRLEGLVVELPYPLSPEPLTFDPGYDVAYDINWEDFWSGQATIRNVVTIDVRNRSPFRTEDYAAWNAWKSNFSTAAQVSRRHIRSDRIRYDDSGLILCRYEPLPEPVRFLAGWGEQEAWGRWANESTASILVPAIPGPLSLSLMVAPFEGQSGIQECRIFHDDELLSSFKIFGKPWRWQDWEVPLPGPGNRPQRIEFRFARLSPGNEQDSRSHALPFRGISLAADSGWSSANRLHLSR